MTDAIQTAINWCVGAARREAEARQAEALAKELTEAIAESLDDMMPSAP